ncbi:mannose-1-phosphate guanylyltransferase/mannose-6-phosphate isomerase [Escherichia marmotae]|uniref:mannose-1-phosphate guanylyltransferase/mannose-6-phosphate isomerase n=1 Tax=Escherichia marmotae TaxID=1499973 RepID=UPI000F905924|nr:mannose-1-phosphate guanylyltransferase/mannose-6-phosphate isomerase [Escherichia marmotae]MIA78458.1 mannose-1-phosphate guanylyltransferase/mannose-6-phosphate isomerase [Escherichia coli]MEC9635228.1 mannose-1-phosphate guanylyltransferase/mannose-6-phosphate isomerase [Escherichia marmotae]MEC9693911.1 mannose-1-phosphate guanylyltransferase/mannose-6-phosphate isomerase [Escherichia marmotae]MEC9801971.1 mannose-1-phosphate guanylyltransferase/mannose-6-phosphate isomerase [Escherichia
MIIPIIMAGGSGTRLWPLSRSLFPKQFLDLFSKDSLIQGTLNRLNDKDYGTPIVITNNEYRFLVKEQIKKTKYPDSRIILEPVARNTAPAIAVSAFISIKNGDDPLLLVMPSDHIIKNEKQFSENIKKAREYAEKGYLVTFGIKPTSPETGYGYIKASGSVGEGIYGIERFVEKPSLNKAVEYISDGNYSWNSGIFLFKASTLLQELNAFRPEIYESCLKSVNNAITDLGFLRIDPTSFANCPSDSIDFAVMELTNKGVVVPVDIGWSDVGSWSALWEVSNKDDNNNVANGDIYLNETSNSYIYSKERFVACVGVDDIIVVDTSDALLVVSKNNVQKVKDVVNHLMQNNRPEYQNHNEQFRPWGSHDVVSSGSKYNIKRVVIKPGHSSSEQIHYNRAEHWIVISGTALVMCGDKIKTVKENESTFIPAGVKHNFSNPGKIDLEIIEVQTGPYLAEDDIYRD